MSYTTMEKLVDGYRKTSLENKLDQDGIAGYSKGDTLLNNAKNMDIKRNVTTWKDVLCNAKNCSIKGNVGGLEGDKRGIDVLVKSEKSHIEGNVSAGNVLKDANDSYVEGEVNSGQCVLHKTKNSHIKGNVKSRGSVLYESISSYIKGDVSSGGDVLDKVKNCYIEGDIKSGPTVLWKAEGSHVKGKVNCGNSVLTDAKDSYIEGEVYSGIDVLLNAKKSHIIGNVTCQGTLLNESDESYIEGDADCKGDVLNKAKKSHIKGNVKSTGDVLKYARNSFIKGNVENKGFTLYDSKNSYICGNVKSETSLLNNCKNCYVVGERIAAPNLGWHANGGLAAVKKIDCSNGIGEELTILTQSNIKDTVKFMGDWNELSDFLAGELDKENFGQLEALELFIIEKKRISLKGLKKELSRLNKDYAKVKSAFKDYEALENILGLSDIWYGNNKSKKDYLNRLDAEIKDKLKKEFKITDKTAGLIKNNSQLKELISELSVKKHGEYRSTYIFEDTTEMSIDDFFEKYRKRNASGFDRTYNLKLKTAASEENIGKTNEMLCKQGRELIEQICTTGVGLDMSWDIDVKDDIDLIKYCGKQIGELKRKGEDATEFMEKKEKAERALKGTKLKKVWEFVERWGEDITHVSDLKECLSQLSQHYLGGKHKQIAEHISSQLVVSENDLSSNILHAKLWNKDVNDLPTYEEFRCCGFLGGGRGAIFGYMASNAVELMKFEIGDKSAMAIMAETKDENGKKVLLVDSVESASHMLSREDIAAAVANAIEDYAREKGFAEIIYSKDAGNNAPREFVAALSGHENASDMKLKLTDDLDVYLEANVYRGVSGKMKKIGGGAK